MNTTMQDILELKLFREAVVLCGANGLNRIVHRISVFDCPLEDDDANIIQSGDVFISGLHQFPAQPEKVKEFLHFLNDANSSGLFITNENQDLIQDNVLRYADTADFPIILVDKSNSYASIIEAVNDLILADKFHAINELKVERILRMKLSSQEVSETLQGMNPGICSQVMLILLSTTDRPTHVQSNINAFTQRQDMYIRYIDSHIILISGNDAARTESRTRIIVSRILASIQSGCCGISSAHSRLEFAAAMEEARIALLNAETAGETCCWYQGISIMNVLIVTKDNEQLLRYYHAVKETIIGRHPDDKLDLITCITEFVLCKGNYKRVAEKLNQHENTIRYRISKVRSILGLEDDLVQFHETISLFVKIHMLFRQR